MWNEMDIAAIKAILGVETWVDGEEDMDLTFLADKMCQVGLTFEEQERYDALQALYISGR